MLPSSPSLIPPPTDTASPFSAPSTTMLPKIATASPQEPATWMEQKMQTALPICSSGPTEMPWKNCTRSPPSVANAMLGATMIRTTRDIMIEDVRTFINSISWQIHYWIDEIY